MISTLSNISYPENHEFFLPSNCKRLGIILTYQHLKYIKFYLHKHGGQKKVFPFFKPFGIKITFFAFTIEKKKTHSALFFGTKVQRRATEKQKLQELPSNKSSEKH